MAEQIIDKPGDLEAPAIPAQAEAIQTKLLSIDLDTLAAVLAAQTTKARKRLEKAHRRVRTIQHIRTSLSSTQANPRPAGFDAAAGAAFLNEQEVQARLRLQAARAACASLGQTKAPMRRLRQLAQALADALPEQKARREAITAAQMILMPKDQ